MKTDYTHISIVLDRSGSMASVRNDTIGGFNSFLSEQRKTPGQATVSLAQFDDEYESLYAMADIQSAKDLTLKSYVPRGSTPLYGAIGRMIDDTGRALEKMAEIDRPAKVVVLIVTDGEENHTPHEEWSRIYDIDKVRSSIKHQSEAYGWQFVYIGANQDAILNAKLMGIDCANALNYTANTAGTQALYEAASSNLRSFRTGGSVCMGFSDEQRDEQEKAKSKKK